MQSTTDTELLHAYAREGSEVAFGEIVRRYADFVYSAALRQVADPELARDVAQLVFVDLARKAAALPPKTLLIGWLCRGARLAALDQLRRQQRRQQRERQAMELNAPSPEPVSDWSAVGPVLDEALAGLAEEDRHALLLRFFKNESLAAVGATLGVSEDAAQKRVSRALGKLRDFLAERGIHTSAAALAVVLAANAVQAAPPGFAAALTAGALAQAAGHSSISLLNLLTSQTMKTALLSLIAAGGVAGFTVQHIHAQRELRAAQTTIQQQSESLQGLPDLQKQLTAQSNELEQLRADQQEVVRLRGEVARLRREAAAMPKTAVVQSAPASVATAPATNAALPSVGLTAKFVLLPTEALKLLPVAWNSTPDGTATAVLTSNQVQTLDQALEGASDVKVLGRPRVLTAPGSEARLFAGPKMSGGRTGASQRAGGGVGGGESVGGISTTTTITQGGGLDANSSPGLALSVLPAFTQDGTGFDLQVSAGFGQWGERSPQATEAKAHLVLPAGQTVLLVKEVQSEGWTEANNTVPGPKSLLVFLTPSRVQTADRLVRIVERATNH